MIQRGSTAEELALELLEALKEQVAECLWEDCKMCARHEEIIRRTNAHLKGEAHDAPSGKEAV